MNIIEAIKDENLFRPFFGENLTSWKPWLIALRVLYGLPVTSKFGRNLIRECTGRDPRKLPPEGFDTALFLTGRRSGKSRISAVIGAYAGVLSGAHSKLAAGETGLVPVITPTIRQGSNVKGYLRALFDAPMLHAQLVSDRKDAFECKNNVRVEVLPADHKHTRGYTLLTVVVDEVCFFGLDDESKIRSDTELIRALQPALATTNGKLIAISSPYAKRGWAYTTFEKNFGNDSSHTLVWRAPSRTMNPTLRQSVIDRAMKEDLAAAKSEYYAEWREDVGLFVPREVVEALVVKNRLENLPRDHRYCAFADISGGRIDGSALAIAHKEGRKVVLDFCKLWKAPHNPHQVIASMAEELRRFRIYKVVGDAYGADYCSSSFASNSVHYTKADRNKSALYAELLALLCAGEIELLDNPTLVGQLASLERRTRSGGKDIIDHPRGAKDDLANAVAGVAVVTAARRILCGAGGF